MTDANSSNQRQSKNKVISIGQDLDGNTGDNLRSTIFHQSKQDVHIGQKKITEGKYEEAIRHFLTTLETLEQDLSREKLDSDQHSQKSMQMQIFQQIIASTYHNIGLCHRKLGHLTESAEAFSLAIQQYQMFDDPYQIEATIHKDVKLESDEDELQIRNKIELCNGNEMSSSSTISSSLLFNKPQHQTQSLRNPFLLNQYLKISESLFSLAHVYKELSKQKKAKFSSDDTTKHQLRHMKTAIRCYKQIISILTNDINTCVHSSIFSSMTLHSKAPISSNFSSLSGKDANILFDENFEANADSTNESRSTSTPLVDSLKLPLDGDRIRKRLLMLANTYMAMGDIYNEAHQINDYQRKIKKKQIFSQIINSYENAFTIIGVIISLVSDLSFQSSELSSNFALGATHCKSKDGESVENIKLTINKDENTSSIHDLKQILADIKLNIAYHHFVNNQFDHALITYKEALNLHLKINEVYNESDIGTNITKENYLLVSNKQRKPDSTIISIINKIGIIHEQRNELDDASKCFEWIYFQRYNNHLQHENKKIHINPDLANAINNLSNVYLKQGKRVEALDFYRKAIQIYWSNVEQCDNQLPNQGYSDVLSNSPLFSRKRNLLLRISGVARNIAEAYLKLGSPPNALNVLKDVDEITKAAYGSDHLQVGRVAQKMGEIYSRLNMAENASFHLNNAIRIYKYNHVSSDDPMCVTIKSILNFMNLSNMKSESSNMIDFKLMKNDNDGSNLLNAIQENFDITNEEKNKSKDTMEHLEKYPIQARNISPNMKRAQPQLDFIYIDNHDDDSISQITYHTSDFIKQVQQEENSGIHWHALQKLKDLGVAIRASARKRKQLKTGKLPSRDQTTEKEKSEVQNRVNFECGIQCANDLQGENGNPDCEGIEFTLEQSKYYQSKESGDQSEQAQKQVNNTDEGNLNISSGKGNIAKARQKPKMYILHGMVPQENSENGYEEDQNQIRNINENEPSPKFYDLLANMLVVHGEMDSNELTKAFAEVLEEEKVPSSSKEKSGSEENRIQTHRNKKKEQYKLEIHLLTNTLASQKSKFGDHPTVAEVAMKIAAIYVELEEFNDAMHYYKETLRIQKNLSHKYDVDIATTLSCIGEISFCRNDYDAALQSYEEVLKIKSMKLGEYDPEVGRTLNRLGEIYENKGDYDLAIDYHQHALAILNHTLGERNYDVFRTLGLIGTVMFRKHTKNLSSQESLKTYKSRYILLENGCVDIKMCHRIGVAYIFLSQFSKAMRVFKEIALLQGKENKNPETLNCIGQIYRQIGQYDKALKKHHQSLQVLKRTLTSNDHRVLWSKVLIGMTELCKGNYAKTVDILEAVLPLLKSSRESEVQTLGLTLRTLSDVKVKLCEYSAAMALLQKAFRIQIPNLGNDDPDTLSTKIRIGNVLAQQGKLDEALLVLKQVEATKTKIQLPDNCSIATDILHSLGKLFGMKNDLINSMRYYQKAFEMRINIYGENHPDVATTLNAIGDTYTKSGDPARALQAYKDVLRVQIDMLGPNHLDKSNTLISMGFAYHQLSKNDKTNYEKAMTHYNEALEIIVKNVGDRHILVADVLVLKGKTMSRKCEYTEANLEFTKALNLYKSWDLDESNPKIVDLMNFVERVEREKSLWV